MWHSQGHLVRQMKHTTDWAEYVQDLWILMVLVWKVITVESVGTALAQSSSI